MPGVSFLFMGPHSMAPRGAGSLVESGPPSVVQLYIFLGIFGAVFTGLPLSAISACLKRRRAARKMLSGEARAVYANITSKRSWTTKQSPEDPKDWDTLHCAVSYWFEARREDGITCRVTVTNRVISEEYFNHLQEGTWEPVFYHEADPQVCRLDRAAHDDSTSCMNGSGVCCLAVFTTPFMLIGTLVGFFGPLAAAQTSGSFSPLIGTFIWVTVIGLILAYWGKPIPGVLGKDGVELEELGKREPKTPPASLGLPELSVPLLSNA